MRKNSQAIEQILEVCLDLIYTGQETLDSVLARYADLADELRPEIEAALWLRSRAGHLNPRPGFITTSRHRVVDRIKQEKATSLAQSPLWGLLQQSWQKRLALQIAMALALVVALFITGSAVAAASSSSIPGEPLYPVKTVWESIQLATSMNDARDTQLHIRFAGQRSIEIQELVLEGDPEHIGSTAVAFESQVDQAICLLNVVAAQNPTRAQDLANSLKETLSDQTMVLIALVGAVPTAAKPDVEKVIITSEQAMTAVEEIREQIDKTMVIKLTPTSSPTPSLTLTATQIPSLTPSNTPAPTFSQVIPTATVPALQPISTPTSVAVPSTSDPSEPTYTPSPKSTGKPPTNTPRPTNTHKVPTNTPKPTNSSRPTNPVKP